VVKQANLAYRRLYIIKSRSAIERTVGTNVHAIAGTRIENPHIVASGIEHVNDYTLYTLSRFEVRMIRIAADSIRDSIRMKISHSQPQV